MGNSQWHDMLLTFYGEERLRYIYLVRDPRDGELTLNMLLVSYDLTTDIQRLCVLPPPSVHVLHEVAGGRLSLLCNHKKVDKASITRTPRPKRVGRPCSPGAIRSSAQGQC